MHVIAEDNLPATANEALQQPQNRINISLGRNCEVTFALKKSNFSIESSLLNWAYVGSQEGLFVSIQNPNLIFSRGGLLVNANMFKCRLTGLSFHGKTTFDNYSTLAHNSPLVLNSYNEIKSRTAYLASKFKVQIEHKPVNAFIKPPRDIATSKQFALQLRNLIDSHYPLNCLRLFVVSEGGYFAYDDCTGIRNLFLCSISSYTHDSASDRFTQKALSDWIKIFKLANA